MRLSRTFYLGAFLMVLCLVSAGALGYTFQLTQPRIQAHYEEARQRAMSEALPGADEFTDAPDWVDEKLDDPEFAEIDEANVGKADDRRIGYVFTASPYGYADEIVMMVGISEQQIKSIEILRQAETPGLGARITGKDWQAQFSGLPINEEIAVVQYGGQIDSLTGATVSSEAVAAGVDMARRLYERIRKER